MEVDVVPLECKVCRGCLTLGNWPAHSTLGMQKLQGLSHAGELDSMKGSGHSTLLGMQSLQGSSHAGELASIERSSHSTLGMQSLQGLSYARELDSGLRIGTSFVDLLCFCSVLCLLCFVRVCLYVLRGHLLGKG